MDNQNRYSISAVISIISLGMGIIGGAVLGKIASKPARVYTQTRNNANYIIVENFMDVRYIFVAQPDGSYKPFSQIQNEQRSELEEILKQIK
jgi:hypothetical protein